MNLDEELSRRGIRDERVLAAMRKVRRDLFVPVELRENAWDDSPLPIGYGQTISQPYVVAYMTELLRLSPSDKVLEVGTGSGYQAAILAEIARAVHTIEIVEPLCRSARERLRDLGYRNLTVHCGDGHEGLPKEAPFDAVMVTAAPEEVPQPLVDQLAAGGRLVIPVGPAVWAQALRLITKDAKGRVHTREDLAVRFVPMTRGRD